MGPGEIRRTERWLATARVSLALASLVAIWMDPAEVRYSLWAYGLLAFYVAQGVIIIIFLRRRQESTPSFRLLVHSADVVWPALISAFVTGQGNPFSLFFVFVLAAAAYRWGLWETMGTAVAAVLVLWIESFCLIHLHIVDRVNGFLLSHKLRPASVASEYHRLRAQAPLHALRRSARIGHSARISGRAAETASRGESGNCQNDREGKSRGRAYRNYWRDCRRTAFDVRGETTGHRLARNQQLSRVCRRIASRQWRYLLPMARSVRE